MPSTHRFTFHGEGDHDPGKEQGDIVIQLEEKEHATFQRHGCDLSMKMDLSLAEALCGFRAPIETLDKRTIVVSTAPGEVITHGAMKTVAEEGFPKHKDPFNKGRLIIVFNVQFPPALSAEAAKKLRQALPKGPQRPAIPEDAGMSCPFVASFHVMVPFPVSNSVGPTPFYDSGGRKNDRTAHVFIPQTASRWTSSTGRESGRAAKRRKRLEIRINIGLLKGLELYRTNVSWITMMMLLCCN